MGHFHTTVGGAVSLTFVGLSYLLPILFGRGVLSTTISKAQPYIWFLGMLVFSIAYRIAGIRRAPRKTYSYNTAASPPAHRSPCCTYACWAAWCS